MKRASFDPESESLFHCPILSRQTLIVPCIINRKETLAQLSSALIATYPGTLSKISNLVSVSTVLLCKLSSCKETYTHTQMCTSVVTE